MKVTNPELVDSLFPSVLQAISEPNVQNFLTLEQKQAVLDAVGCSLEEISDAHVRVTFLCMVLDVDATDENNPSISISFDLNALAKLTDK